MKNIARYFIQGLLVIVPVAITALVVFKIISFFSGLFASFGIIVNPVVDFFIVGSISILFILLVGFLGSSFFFGPIFSAIEHWIERAPLIKVVYSSIKDFLSAFVGSKKKFNRPVLVDIDKQNKIQQIGFITNENLSQMDLPEDKVAVYFPFSYSFTGKLLLIAKENVHALDISSSEVMKFVVSGGVTEID